MIIWINGAFGSGKTEVACELHRRIEKSFIFDSEETGAFIRDNMPREVRVDDFQDYPMWRNFNVSMLSYIASKYDGVIICPMTITNKEYFRQIIDVLREEGIGVYHFTLIASEETLKARLRMRGESEDSWAVQQITRCVNALGDRKFKEHIVTDNKTIDEVAEEIRVSLR